MTSVVDAHSATVALSPISVTLGVPKEVELTLDEAWSPYVRGTIRFPMPSSADRAAVDLRAYDLLCALQLRRDFGGTWTLAQLTAAGGGSAGGLTTMLAGGAASNITHKMFKPWTSGERASQIRDCSLAVTARDFDDEAQELVLAVASLEEYLHRDALISAVALNPSTTDLATIVQWVLARRGYALAAGWSTATVAQVAATIWQPGVTAFDYLDPMLQAAGLKLWADEKGSFQLSARQFNTSGALNLTTSSLTRNVDHMTFDPELYADAVVVKYSWTDGAGVSQVTYDVAGSTIPKAAQLVELDNTIYPGPGAASGILSRLQNRGRVLDDTALSDYTVTPGMPTTIFPPNTSSQTGYLSSVTFRLPSAEMDLTTRGLTDTPTDSWLFGNSKTWNAVGTDNPTLQWSAFDWSLT